MLDQKKTIDAQLQQTLAAQKQTEQQKAASYDAALADQPQMPAQEQFNQQQPIPDHEAFAKTAPLLTIFAALGGKLTKMSGLTMLKATNAMIAGTISGNQEAYTQAKKVYDDEYAKFAERQKQKMQIYKDQLTAWKDTYQGREKSWQIASSAVGDTLTQLKDVQTNETSILRAQAQLMKEKKAQAKQADDLKWFKAGETADTNYRKVEATIPRLEMADETISNVKAELPALLADLKKALGKNATAPVPLGDLLKKYGDDPRVGQLVARINALKTALIGIESSGAGSMRSNQFIQQIFAKTAPDVFNNPASQIMEATDIDAKMIHSAYTKAKGDLDREKARAEFARGKVRGLPSGETPDEGGDIFSAADAIIGK